MPLAIEVIAEWNCAPLLLKHTREDLDNLTAESARGDFSGLFVLNKQDSKISSPYLYCDIFSSRDHCLWKVL